MKTWSFEETKPTWGEGPWLTEPDKAQWVDETTGLDCLAVRSTSMGCWCGYVGVPLAHPLFGASKRKAEWYVGHGVNFAKGCQEENPERGVCHVPEPGRPERIWWIGFDCGHALDHCPKMESRAATGFTMPEEYLNMLHYWTLDEVQEKCASLALVLWLQGPWKERYQPELSGQSN